MPAVTIGDNTGDTYSGSNANRIDLFQPTTVITSSIELQYEGASFPAAGLVKFGGLSNITGPVTVSAATLYLWLSNEQNSFENATLRLRRLIRNWNAAQATWNIYSTGNNWGTAGARNSSDRVDTASATPSGFDSGQGQYYPITSAGLIQDVQDWINGVNSNYGWLIELTNNIGYKRFDTHTATSGQRPYLSLTYEGASPVAKIMQMLLAA